MTTLFNREVKLHDINGHMTEIKLEITDRNGYPKFTMSNECGQGQDNIKPRTDNQKKLLRIWSEWHLNGMHAGTEKQEDVLEAWKLKWDSESYNYDARVDYLKKHKLDGSDLSIVEYDKLLKAIEGYMNELKAFSSLRSAIMNQKNVNVVEYKPETDLEKKYFERFIWRLPYDIVISKDQILQSQMVKRSPSHVQLVEALESTVVDYSEDIFISAYAEKYAGVPYMYGHGWITKSLPEDFHETLDTLCDALDSEEDDYGSNPITEDMITDQRIIDKADELDTTVEKLMAMYLFAEMSIESIDNIEHNYDNEFEIEWQDYLVCTDEEADEAQDKDFDNYIEECILPELNERNRQYFDNDAWKKDAKHDGRGHGLATYDGHENSQHAVWIDFYFYKR